MVMASIAVAVQVAEAPVVASRAVGRAISGGLTPEMPGQGWLMADRGAAGDQASWAAGRQRRSINEVVVSFIDLPSLLTDAATDDRAHDYSSLTSTSLANGNASDGNMTGLMISTTTTTQRPRLAGMAELNSDSSDTPPVYMQHIKVILVILHVSVFITGLVGNSLVCLSVYRNKSLQTVTNYYIVNLAIADFLVILICLPPSVYWDINLYWNFGLVLCKLVLYLQVSVHSRARAPS